MRILVIILLSFLLTGCEKKYTKTEVGFIEQSYLEENALDYVRNNYSPEEVYPDKIILNRSKADPVVSNVHGTLPKNSSPEDGYLIINKKSKVFHHSDCDSVKDMKESNKIVSNRTVTELKEQGYSPCGKEDW